MNNYNNIPGGMLRRGEPGYEEARRGSCWNARLADRYPALIVLAHNTSAVVDAVRLARREGLQIAVRSGGHSWTGNHVRDGGMLIDLSQLADVSINRRVQRAVVGPGVAGHELVARLAKEDLFFPAGHCKGVGLGGYLLQGGFGWNSRELGPACMSLRGFDYVDAEGNLRHASQSENPDVFWAARGAGPGFFGVITRFHLRVYPRPRVIGGAFATFPVSRLEEVFRWAHAIGPEVPESVELMLLMSRKTAGVKGAGISVVAPVFADSWGEARQSLRFMKSLPRGASRRLPFLPTGLNFLYNRVMQHYPDGHRYAVDNMWTHAGIDELLPGLERIAATLPPAPSHMLWMNWAPPESRPDMAFSMEDKTYIALYGAWQQASDDAQHAVWAMENMLAMAPLASGCQLADENLGLRPARFMADRNLARMDELRARHDPESRFFSWMGRPPKNGMAASNAEVLRELTEPGP